MADAVRRQLIEALARGVGTPVKLGIESVVLELGVEFRDDEAVAGGVRAWVFSANAEGRSGAADSERITVTMSAKTVSGESLTVGSPDQGSRVGF